MNCGTLFAQLCGDGRSHPFPPASVGVAWLSLYLHNSGEQAGERLKRACIAVAIAVTRLLIKGSSTEVLFCFVFNSIFFLSFPSLFLFEFISL